MLHSEPPPLGELKNCSACSAHRKSERSEKEAKFARPFVSHDMEKSMPCFGIPMTDNYPNYGAFSLHDYITDVWVYSTCCKNSPCELVKDGFVTGCIVGSSYIWGDVSETITILIVLVKANYMWTKHLDRLYAVGCDRQQLKGTHPISFFLCAYQTRPNEICK